MMFLLLAPQLFGSASAHDGGHEHAPVVSDAAPTPIPATFAEVVAAMRDAQTAASRAVEEGRLADVHAVARSLVDLATAAPGRASGIDPSTVALNALAVKTAAEALHHAADDGDAVGARAAIDRLTDPLVTLSALGG